MSQIDEALESLDLSYVIPVEHHRHAITSPEQLLAEAVILQAMTDATRSVETTSSKKMKRVYEKYRKDALEWMIDIEDSGPHSMAAFSSLLGINPRSIANWAYVVKEGGKPRALCRAGLHEYTKGECPKCVSIYAKSGQGRKAA